MDKLLLSDNLSLRAATQADKHKIFTWLTQSNLTEQMLGLPHYPDNPIPNWEEFDKDYLDHYLDDTQPLQGRCFIILYQGQEIGEINYNSIDPKHNSTEIDIWLADKQFTGQGFGPEALQILCRYLNKRFGCRKIYIQPSRRNPRAIYAYKKAGFKEQAIWPKNFEPDYYDSLLMEKTLGEES